MWSLRKIYIMPTIRQNLFRWEIFQKLRSQNPRSSSLSSEFFFGRSHWGIWDREALSTCNVSKWYLKMTKSSYKGMMNDGTPLSSSDSEMASKVKKNRRAIFEKKLIFVVIILKSMMMHCLRIIQKDLPLY